MSGLQSIQNPTYTEKLIIGAASDADVNVDLNHCEYKRDQQKLITDSAYSHVNALCKKMRKQGFTWSRCNKWRDGDRNGAVFFNLKIKE